MMTICFLLLLIIKNDSDIFWYPNHMSAQFAATPVLVPQLPLRNTNTVCLLHFLTGHMVEYDFLFSVLPLIAQLDLFRIF